MSVGSFKNLATRKITSTPILSGSLFIAVIALSVGPFSNLHADENAEDDAGKSSVSFRLPGVVESTRVETISADTEQFKTLSVKEIVSHGAQVKPGDAVVKFDTEPYEKSLEESARALRLAEIAFEADQLAHRQFEAEQKLDRQAAERAWQIAKETFENYMEVDKERSVLSAKFSLKQSLATLMNVREELKQLEQMYKEDDLTEESEEIVLKRAKQAVESAEFRHESATIQAKRTIEQQIPKTIQQQQETLERAELTYEKAIRTIESEAEKHQIGMDEKETKLQETRSNHEELVNDKNHLQLTGELAGIAVYGELQRGKLSDKPPQFKEGASVNSEQVIVTIMDPTQLQVRLVIPEAHLAKVKAGDDCLVTFTSLPDQKVEATVGSVQRTPFASTQYDCVIKLSRDDIPSSILPLMTCEVHFAEESGASDSE